MSGSQMMIWILYDELSLLNNILDNELDSRFGFGNWSAEHALFCNSTFIY